MYNLPYIPEYIIVHLGNPSSNDKNLRVRFVEYIKNVASGEIYPNWPDAAIRANVYAIISFALNRYYNEWYRSSGYNFDITSSSQYDQSFSEDRQFFERIYVIVDEIFNSYIVRSGQVQPLFATYCDGRVSTCNGLSQWGTVSLANQGKGALDILKNYYGKDIRIVSNVDVLDNFESFPGYNLTIGDASDGIRLLKIQLNRIGRNYPAIPAIINDTIFFDVELENVIKKFQSIFTIPVTGVIDNATWYKIKYLYNAVKDISNLYSEGIKLEEVELKYPKVLKLGNTGEYIRELNYFLNTIAYFDESIPYVKLTSTSFTEQTKDDVEAFQKKYNMEITGEVDYYTWNKIREVYKSMIKTIPEKYFMYVNEFFSGRYLSKGMKGEDVVNLQRFLYLICENEHIIPGVIVSGDFDSLTEKSVKKIQEIIGVDPDGIVSAYTWFNIVELSK